ncbi:S8 family serine peptidase [Microbispora triticiradicis]|nr:MULTISPECIES: S8 family serine peptidase [Microbispora]
MDERIVEIAGDEGSSPGRYMQYVFDAGTGTYLRPADSEQMLAFRERGVKAAYLQAQAGAEFDADALERAWPEIWRELTRKRPEPTPEYYAVLDTGLLSRHPLLRGLIVDGTNLTTEPDGEDANGHGTMVALILAAGLTRRPRLLNVKVADGNGRATPRDLVKGIEWVRDFARRTSSPVCVNISLGCYSRRWGLFACDGTCDVCEAAVAAAGDVRVMTVAAGNEPNRTTCPAMAGLRGRADNIFAVAQLGWDRSGVGTVAMPAGMQWIPYEEDGDLTTKAPDRE